MATQTLLQEQSAALYRLVRGWDRRLRLQQAFLWLPRCLLPGLMLGTAAAIISRVRPWLLPGEVLALAAAGLALGLALMLLAVWLWPRPRLAAARRFDLTFGLQERVSTALELLEGRISGGELAARQIEDAWARANVIRPGEGLPVVWRWRDWLVVLALAAALLLLLALPNPQADDIVRQSARQVALADAAEQLRSATQEIAADITLSPEEREQLLQALEASTNTLQESGISPEEAFASLSDTQAALQNQAERLLEQQTAQQAAMQAAAETLGQLPQFAPETGDRSPIPTLEELRQNLEQLSLEEQQQTAQILEQAARSLQQADPNAAGGLQEAAEALRQADSDAAAQALEQASAALQQSAQAQQRQRESAEALNDAARSMQLAAQRLTEQEQAAQQTSQGEGQESAGADESDQPGQSGQDMSEGDQQPQQPQQAITGMGEGEPPEQSAAESADGSGAGAGDAPGGEGTDELSGRAGSDTGEVDQDNNPDGQGEGQFEPVFAPRRIGGQGDQQIVLEPDTGELPVIEGDFADNPTGQAFVPYNQVFSDYQDAANRALERDYIPLGLRDVVHDYFASLEPGRGGR